MFIVNKSLTSLVCWLKSLLTTLYSARRITESTPPQKEDEGNFHRVATEKLTRKLSTLRKCGLFAEGTSYVTIQRACTLEDLRAAYELVYQIYVGTGFIAPETSRIRLRVFEARPDTATFVAKVGGRVVGTLSIVPDSPEMGLPSDNAFRKELDALRGSKIRLCEATNQALSPEYRKSAVSTDLMRCAVAHVTDAGFGSVIATVSPSHQGFYDLLRFYECGSQRSYSAAIDDPVIALRMDIDQFREPLTEGEASWKFIYEFMATGNHFLAKVGDWGGEARAGFLQTSLLRELFSVTDFLDQCDVIERRILRSMWGRRLYASVTERPLGTRIQERVTALLCWLDTVALIRTIFSHQSALAH